MTTPRGLYQVADWLAETTLPAALGIPPHKFNDDRLGQTLEDLAPHLRDIWLEVVQQALLHFDINLGFIFYDLTAFMVHGEYQRSQLADFGFAHNTPMGKRKLGLNTTADGHFPLDHALWPGRRSDVATVVLEDLIYTAAHPTAIGDYDKDGIPDLMVKFDRQALIDYLNGATGDIVLTVSGELVDGTAFAGEDTVRVINAGVD